MANRWSSPKRCARFGTKYLQSRKASYAIDYHLFTDTCLLTLVLLPLVAKAQGPVFVITPEESTVLFNVKASVAIEGILDIKIQAATVNR